MRMLIGGLVFLILNPVSAPAQSMNAAVNIEGIKWGDAPPALPKGAQMAVISGDPSKEGLYVIRLKMPADYRIPAHNHPTAEYVTVISGVFGFGISPLLWTFASKLHPIHVIVSQAAGVHRKSPMRRYEAVNGRGSKLATCRCLAARSSFPPRVG